MTATFMPRKPLDNERKAWQAYYAGQTIGLPMLPFPRLQRLVVKRIVD